MDGEVKAEHIPQQTKGNMRMREATQRLKVMVISSFIVHLQPLKVLVRERMQTLLYLVKSIVAAKMVRLIWTRQATIVQYTEQILHLYLQAPMNMKMALRPMIPQVAPMIWAMTVIWEPFFQQSMSQSSARSCLAYMRSVEICLSFQLIQPATSSSTSQALARYLATCLQTLRGPAAVLMSSSSH